MIYGNGGVALDKNKQKKQESEVNGFMSGVALLSLSTLVVKLIGLAFKIPMLSFLGTEGMGYFNSAYEIYAILCIVSTAGLPVALSMLVSSAKERGDALEIKRTFTSARRLLLVMGSCGSLVTIVFSKQLAVFIGNPDSYASIIAIAPALLFICLASAVRGYCQGFGSMVPTAISQLIEAFSKLGFGILFAAIAIKKGYSVNVISAFAVFGITLGTFLSLLYLSVARRTKKYKASAKKTISEGDKKGRKALGRLVAIAFPITLGSLVIGMTRIIDMTLIMRRLQDIGVSIAESNKIYGAYTTLSLPIFSLIPSLIAPVSMALVPQLVATIERKDANGQRVVVENAMRLTTVFAIPASLGVVAFSEPILRLLFGPQREAIEISAPLLCWLGISIVFSCLITTTNAILQSYRKVMLPILSMSIGVLVKLVVSYLLIGDARFGALGAPLGSLACNVTVSTLNLWFMKDYLNVSWSIKRVFFKPLAASVFAVGSAIATYVYADSKITAGNLPFIISAFVCIFVYIATSFCVGNLTDEDIALLPFGSKVLKCMKKIKLRKTKNIGGQNDDLR